MSAARRTVRDMTDDPEGRLRTLHEHLEAEHGMWWLVSTEPWRAHQAYHDMTQVDGDEQYHVDAFHPPLVDDDDWGLEPNDEFGLR